MAMQGVGVNIWANTAQLVEGVNKAISQFSRMETAIKRIGGIMGVAFSVNQIVSFTKNTLEAADALVENAQKAGISAANLKLYSMAAELSGTETKALMTGIGILSKNMAGLSKEGSGAVKALEEMGINTKTVKGELLPTEAVLMQVADKFAVMKDGAGKTATAMALFGKAGKELIPFLNEGSKGVADLQTKLEGLGVKFDELSLQKAAALNDELKILEFAWENLGKQIVMGAVPAIWDVANAMGKASVQGDIFKTMGEGVGSMFKEMALTALNTGEEIEKLVAIFEWMQKKGDEWKKKPFFDRFFFGGESKVPSVGPQLSAIASQYAERRKSLEAGTPFTAPKKKTGEAPDIANVSKALDKATQEWNRVVESINNYRDAIERTNPLLTEEAKQILQINQHYTDMVSKINGMTEATDAEKENLKGYVATLYDTVLGYQQLITEMEQIRVAAENEAIVYNKLNDVESRRLDTIQKMHLAQQGIIADVMRKQIGEKEQYGGTKADTYTAEYQLRKRILDIQNEQLKVRGQQVYDEEGLSAIWSEQTVIWTEMNKNLAEYSSNMGLFSTSIDTFEKQYEVLNSLREAWGLTNQEIYDGTVNTWVEVADVVTSATEQMSQTLSNVMVGFVKGTVDARAAVEQLATSILENVIQALIKIGIQQILLATIGKTIQSASTATTVDSMASVAAAAAPAASLLAMATFGASATAGTTAFMTGLAGMMGASMAAITASQGMAAGTTGMADGGVINEHIIGRGTSGRLYEFGEAGPERVTPMRGRKSASTINININGAVLNNYDELARVLVPAIRKAEYDGV